MNITASATGSLLMPPSMHPITWIRQASKKAHGGSDVRRINGLKMPVHNPREGGGGEKSFTGNPYHTVGYTLLPS